ncbi:MAG: nitroreductase family deazaflavin-dependent oxidoreductase [Deltaproteobacteria bacterium]|nr:nitroreductase family deazaflavin-dependent oxidoreductase [Deltaproteobacteria bacterium]MBW2387407.1 nitroreductase family deazaflavin-dependent oxidoreductase [Deltaproteobacteria bacterium]MBW2723043.1 nitroreductase family deazaflavin-dependent oxidoreductase [Deltaproteobacteria bacterium]
MSEFKQEQQGIMAHPGRGLRRWFFRAPLYGWRLGLGPLLRPRFMVLTTRGRKSGRPRHTMLEYVALNGKPYFGAGWGDTSAWVKNLLADPRVYVQSGLGETYGVARRVTDPEIIRSIYPEMKKSPIWKQYTASWGIDGASEDDVAANADRLWTFAIERDEDASASQLEGLRSDLAWVWVLIAGLCATCYAL